MVPIKPILCFVVALTFLPAPSHAPAPAEAFKIQHVDFPPTCSKVAFEIDSSFTDDEVSTIKSGLAQLAAIYTKHETAVRALPAREMNSREWLPFVRETALHTEQDYQIDGVTGPFGEDSTTKERKELAAAKMMDYLKMLVTCGSISKPIRIVRYIEEPDAQGNVSAGMADLSKFTSCDEPGSCEIQLNGSLLASETAPNLWAGVIFHELMHQAGFVHPESNYDTSLIYAGTYAIQRGLTGQTSLSEGFKKYRCDTKG